MGMEESVDLVSELAYGDAGFAFTAFVSILGSTAVSLYGSEETKERHLAPMAADGSYCAMLASERAAGSELTKITTTAARSGDEVVINGDKLFATNAAFGDFLVVIARAATSSDEHLAVVVPREAEGVRIVKRWEMIGIRAAGTYQVSFDRCRASARDILDGSGLRSLEVGAQREPDLDRQHRPWHRAAGPGPEHGLRAAASASATSRWSATPCSRRSWGRWRWTSTPCGTSAAARRASST